MAARIVSIPLVLVSVLACGPTPTQPTSTPLPPLSSMNTLGQYTLTMTASPSCSLPPAVMSRAYEATVFERRAGLIEVAVDTEYLLSCWGCLETGFQGTRDGDALQFDIVGEGGRWFFADLVEDGELRYDGTATATMLDNGNITGTFDGRITILAGASLSPLAVCGATDHKMELVLR